MRIGIQGGTFNPIHCGHLRSAEEVREALGLDQIRFIPSAQPPHKAGEEMAPARDRLEMVRLAVEGHPGFVCDPLEAERGGPSYTVDTLEALAEGPCRGHETVFIIGADAFREVHTWSRPSRFLRMTHLAVTLRGEQRAEEVLRAVEREMRPLDPDLSFEFIGDNQAKVSDSRHVIHFVQISNLDISATQIRRLIRSGRSVRYLLPREVELFIIRRQLYGGILDAR
ncbi:MAG: nicotinate (nicotinamide) nucleotide adenylyltransferase [Candidatus Tectomicrobia bacterium]|uniref:Probable nicotinate-nucleotide adenylyltransferase n=1 Tax=Tectimicrobiota bacterium TaxID=2528274 RepID=A0A932I2P2_UNCTE|nr:nicotinate (nicotinamide) nucleotide adenylyltransferase [Candidatus Tectomicrobia bacterium]